MTPTRAGSRRSASSAGDLRHEARQARHLGQTELDAVLRQLREAPAPEETATRDQAHLVVELRPPHAPASMTEPDEIEGDIVGRPILAGACANPSIYPLLFAPGRVPTLQTAAGC